MLERVCAAGAARSGSRISTRIPNEEFHEESRADLRWTVEPGTRPEAELPSSPPSAQSRASRAAHVSRSCLTVFIAMKR
jgi:hypothetical protein